MHSSLIAYAKGNTSIKFYKLILSQNTKKATVSWMSGKIFIGSAEGCCYFPANPVPEAPGLGKNGGLRFRPVRRAVLRLKHHKIDVPHPLQTYKNQGGFANA